MSRIFPKKKKKKVDYFLSRQCLYLVIFKKPRMSL